MTWPFRELWSQQRWRVLLLLACLAVTLFFAVRLVVSIAYWEANREERLAPWMTLGYVARSYRVPREALMPLALNDAPSRITLRDLAVRRGQPLDALYADIEAAIAAERDAANGATARP